MSKHVIDTPEQKQDIAAISHWLLANVPTVKTVSQARTWAYGIVVLAGHDRTQPIQGNRIDGVEFDVPAPATLPIPAQAMTKTHAQRQQEADTIITAYARMGKEALWADGKGGGFWVKDAQPAYRSMAQAKREVASGKLEEKPMKFLKTKYYPVDYTKKLIYNDPKRYERDCGLGSPYYHEIGTIGCRGSNLTVYAARYNSFTIVPARTEQSEAYRAWRARGFQADPADPSVQAAQTVLDSMSESLALPEHSRTLEDAAAKQAGQHIVALDKSIDLHEWVSKVQELLAERETKDVSPICWPDDNDTGESYCEKHVPSKDFERSWWSEEDGCRHCETCGKVLAYVLTDSGAESETEHYQEFGWDWNSSDDCFHIARILGAYIGGGWFDEKKVPVEAIELLRQGKNAPAALVTPEPTIPPKQQTPGEITWYMTGKNAQELEADPGLYLLELAKDGKAPANPEERAAYFQGYRESAQADANMNEWLIAVDPAKPGADHTALVEVPHPAGLTEKERELIDELHENLYNPDFTVANRIVSDLLTIIDRLDTALKGAK